MRDRAPPRYVALFDPLNIAPLLDAVEHRADRMAHLGACECARRATRNATGHGAGRRRNGFGLQLVVVLGVMGFHPRLCASMLSLLLRLRHGLRHRR